MNVTDGATGFVAYYPYSEDVRIDGTTVNASVPVDQTVEGNYSSRVAKSSSSVLFFNNLTGRLGFEVEMDGVKKVTLKSSVPVAGDISVDFSGSIPVVTAAATEVTLSGDFQRGETYSFTLAAGHLGDCSLSLSDGETVISHYTAENLSLGAGATLSLGARMSRPTLSRMSGSMAEPVLSTEAASYTIFLKRRSTSTTRMAEASRPSRITILSCVTTVSSSIGPARTAGTGGWYIREPTTRSTART